MEYAIVHIQADDDDQRQPARYDHQKRPVARAARMYRHCPLPLGAAGRGMCGRSMSGNSKNLTEDNSDTSVCVTHAAFTGGAGAGVTLERVAVQNRLHSIPEAIVYRVASLPVLSL